MTPDALELLKQKYLGMVSQPVIQPMVDPAQLTEQALQQSAPLMAEAPIPQEYRPQFEETSTLLPRVLGMRNPVQPGNRLIQPAPALPGQAELESMKAPDQSDPAYQNSRLRTVLNAIAGGLAGAGPGGAKAGMEVGAALRNAKYNEALAQYKTNLDLAKTKAGSETSRQKTAETDLQHQINELTQQSLANSRAMNAATNEFRAQTGARAQVSRETHAKALDEYLKFKQTDKFLKNKQNNIQWAFDAPTDEEYQARLQVIREVNEADEKSLERIKDESKVRAEGSAEVAASPLGARAAANTGGARAFAAGSQGAQGAEQGLQAVLQTPTRQKEITQLVDQLKGNPMQFREILATVDPKLKPAALQGYLDAGNNIPTKLDAQQKTAVNNSYVALGHAGNIEKLLNDPEILNTSLGPIPGRVAEVMRAWGGTAIGDSKKSMTPEEQEAARKDILSKLTEGGSLTKKQQQLMGLLAYLVTFEASSASGTRPSWQLIQYLGSRSPQLKMEPDAFLGALEAVKQSATTRIEEALKPRNELGAPMSAKPKSGEAMSDEDFWNQFKPKVKAPGAK